MKYIRTKDRIYELESDFLNNKGVRVGYNVVGQEEVVLIENNSIKQADTIEELCDEFTYEYDNYSKHIRCWKDSNTGKWYDYDTDILLTEKEIATIKGAIWTNQGLKYVAKMNKKGEFELL